MLDAIVGAESFARRWDTPLVGRTRELAVLRDELTASADERRCRLVTVIGAAGVGKTRLVSELVAEVATTRPSPRVAASPTATGSPSGR